MHIGVYVYVYVYIYIYIYMHTQHIGSTGRGAAHRLPAGDRGAGAP